MKKRVQERILHEIKIKLTPCPVARTTPREFHELSNGQLKKTSRLHRTSDPLFASLAEPSTAVIPTFPWQHLNHPSRNVFLKVPPVSSDSTAARKNEKRQSRPFAAIPAHVRNILSFAIDPVIPFLPGEAPRRTEKSHEAFSLVCFR